MTDQTVLPASAQTDEIKLAVAGAGELAHHYDNYAVATQDDYILGAEELKRVVIAKNKLVEQRMSITRPMDDSKKAVMDLFRRPFERLDWAEHLIKKGLGEYSAEQERIAEEQRRIEQERRDKEAARLRREADARREKAAQKERDRIAAEQAERKRLAEIERKKLAAKQKIIDDAKAVADAEEKTRLDEEERRLQVEADAAAERDREEQERLHQEKLDVDAAEQESARADVLESRADDVTAEPVASEVPKVKGISGRKTWKFEITNVAKIPRKYLMVDEKKIGAIVKALKEETDIDGIRAYCTTSTTVRTK